jgi:drug/metabolite transporter (DMT)-like permease
MNSKAKEIYQYILASIIVLAVMAFAVALIFVPIPEQNRDMLNIALGAFLGAFITVVGYNFGSSKGSADKTALMDKSREGAPT